MYWKAATHLEVLEQRLREARLDLLQDPRLKRGIQPGQRPLNPELVERVVQEKIAAAAAYGYEGIEASLRLDAQETLAAGQVDAADARAVLEEAATLLRPPTPPESTAATDRVWSPNLLAGATFAAGALLGIGVYLLLDLHPLLLVCLVGVAGIPAVMTRNWAELQQAGSREHLLDEYPSALCRHYIEALPACVQAYEERVNAVLAEESSSVPVS